MLRERCAEIRRQIGAGIDPSEARNAQKAATTDQDANSFEVGTREWHAKQASGWAASHVDT